MITLTPIGADDSREVEALVYVDTERVGEGEPREEYVYRINRGVEDAVRSGVPGEWVERVVRRFIRGDGGDRGLAERQAGWFEEEGEGGGG